MTIKLHWELEQGSDEWFQARCGILTASEMDKIITPLLKIAANDKARTHVWELLAQRITGYVEPHYISDDMLRGWEDEIEARIQYGEHYAPVKECGFITNDKWGFTLGYSPDGLVGENGMIECKSRVQKYQMRTIVENVAKNTIPEEYMLQVQTGLIVSEREWCDFITYCAGLPMATVRVHLDEKYEQAILRAAAQFEEQLAERRKIFEDTLQSKARLIPTERKEDEEIVL